MLLYIYILLSFFLTVACVLNYAYTYREYFTTVVELTNSAVFRLLCVNSFIMVVVLFWLFARKVCFGVLNPSEGEVVRYAIPLYLLECVGASLYSGIPPFSFVSAFAVFTAVLGVFHRVARERTLTVHVVATRAERVRMLCGLAFFFLLAMPFDLYIVFDVFANRARQQHEGEYLALQYCAAVMYLQLAISNLRLVLRLLFSEVIGESTHGGLAFYVEVLFSLLRSLIFFVSFTYVCFVSHAPFSLMRNLVNHIMTFFKKLGFLIQYRSLTKLLNSIPDASEEVLSDNSQCIICYDTMLAEQGCKQLVCGHCYHAQCLRRWFETMSTCPYCREDLMRPTRRTKAVRPGVDADGRRNENTKNENSTAVTAPGLLATSGSTNATSMSNSTFSADKGGDGAVLDSAGVSRGWRPPDMSEVREEYERYLNRLPRSREQLAQSTATELKGHQQGLSDDVVSQIVKRRDGRSPTFESKVEGIVLPDLVAVVTAGDSACDDVAGASGTNLRKNIKLSKRELQRLDAYKSYEKAVEAAAEALRQRLISIDMSLDE